MVDTGADCVAFVSPEISSVTKSVGEGSSVEGVGGETATNGDLSGWLAPSGWPLAGQCVDHDLVGVQQSGVAVNIIGHKTLRNMLGARTDHDDGFSAVSQRTLDMVGDGVAWGERRVSLQLCDRGVATGAGGVGRCVLYERQDVSWALFAIAATPAAAVAAALIIASEQVAPRTSLLDVTRAPANAMRMRTQGGQYQHLLAARYGVGADQLIKLSRAVDGLDVERLAPGVEQLIDGDAALVRSRHKRAASSQAVAPAKKILYEPGESFEADPWPLPKCCFTGANGLVAFSCKSKSAYPYGIPYKQLDEEGWYVTFNTVIVDEAALNHAVKRFVVDCATVLRDDEPRKRLEARLRVKIDVSAGDDHERIGRNEAMADAIERRAAAAMMRARHAVPPPPPGAVLQCYVYMLHVYRHCMPKGEACTRQQLHTKIAPSARSQARPLWWSKQSVQAIGQQRQPKGYMDDERSKHERTGRVVTTDGVAIFLMACDTRELISRAPKDLVALDEMRLLAAGVPAGTTVVDVHTQTVDQVLCGRCGDALGECRLTRAPARAAAEPAAPREIMMLPSDMAAKVGIGATIDVLWQDAGKATTYSYWRANVVSIVTSAKGVPLHCLTYASHPQPNKWTHDLASDMLRANHPWKIVKPVTVNADATTADKGVPKQGGRDAVQGGPTTRSRANANAMSEDEAVPALHSWAAKLESIIEETVEKAVDRKRTWHSLCYHFLGDAASAYDLDKFGGSIERAADKMYRSARDTKAASKMRAAWVAVLSTGTVLAASKPTPDNVVEVTADSGQKVTLTTPTTLKRLMAAPDYIEWMAEEADAFFNTIMKLPGMELIAMEDANKMAREMRLIIAGFVTVRKYKIVDGKISRRKVRHSVDEATKVRRATGEQAKEMMLRASYTMPVDAVERDTFLASVQPNDTLTLIDYKDAYGNTPRPADGPDSVALVRPPASLDVRMEDGRPACVVMRQRYLWGEGPAGFGFEKVRDIDFAGDGWLRIRDLSSVYYSGDDRAAGIMDDVMCRTRGDGGAKALQLVAHISKCCLARGCPPATAQVDPRMWGGMTVLRSPCKTILTSHMAPHILMATRRYLPEYVENGVLPEGVPKGPKLAKLLSSLRLEQGDGPLSADQKLVQSLVGELRWQVQRQTRIVKAVHMLSCVQQRAPCPDTVRACYGVMAESFDHATAGARTWGGGLGSTQVTGCLKGTMADKYNTTVHTVDGEGKLSTGAPAEVESGVDSTSSNIDGDAERPAEARSTDVYALAVTVNGAAVALVLKRHGFVCGSSASAEGNGLLKCGDFTAYIRHLWRRLGGDIDGPTLMLCDAAASLRVAAGVTAAARLKHELMRSAQVTQRVENFELSLAHLPDAVNFLDFMTKWVSAAKVEASITYLQGDVARRAFEATGGDVTATVMVIAALRRLMMAD